jgi:hypothetical protein
MLLILRDWATRAASRVLVLRDVVRTFAQSVYGFNALGRLKAMTLVPSIADIETAIACAKGADAMALYEAFLVTSKTGANTAEWQLLIGVFGMMLRAGNVVEPFQPIMQLADGRRTMLPADLSQAQLVALRIVFPGPDCPSYRARIGDVLWLTERNVSAGKLAVDSYRLAGVAIGISARPIDADAHYERAARVAKQIDKRGDQLRQQLDFILERAVSKDVSRLGVRKLLSLLYEFRHGDPGVLGKRALDVADARRKSGNFDAARKAYDLAAKLFHRANDGKAAEAARVASAETYVEEADKFSGGLGAHIYGLDGVQDRDAKQGKRIGLMAHKFMILFVGLLPDKPILVQHCQTMDVCSVLFGGFLQLRFDALDSCVA